MTRERRKIMLHPTCADIWEHIVENVMAKHADVRHGTWSDTELNQHLYAMAKAKDIAKYERKRQT